MVTRHVFKASCKLTWALLLNQNSSLTLYEDKTPSIFGDHLATYVDVLWRTTEKYLAIMNSSNAPAGNVDRKLRAILGVLICDNSIGLAEHD
jgi:hypothetical protein